MYSVSYLYQRMFNEVATCFNHVPNHDYSDCMPGNLDFVFVIILLLLRGERKLI